MTKNTRWIVVDLRKVGVDDVWSSFPSGEEGIGDGRTALAKLGCISSEVCADGAWDTLLRWPERHYQKKRLVLAEDGLCSYPIVVHPEKACRWWRKHSSIWMSWSGKMKNACMMVVIFLTWWFALKLMSTALSPCWLYLRKNGPYVFSLPVTCDIFSAIVSQRR